jgi:hypothetical protein
MGQPAEAVEEAPSDEVPPESGEDGAAEAE